MFRIGRLGTTALIVLSILGAGEVESGETVRVRLFSGRVVTTTGMSDPGGGGLTVYDASGPLATLDGGEELEFDIWNEFLRAVWKSGSVPLDRAFVKSEGGTIEVTVDGTSRTYRGEIELVLDGDVEKPGLLIVNEVALPDYVSSVLPSEYGFAEPEGAKAQAIVIRTYALRARSQRRGLYDLTDDTGSQVYLGVSAEHESARAAVAATSGMAITYDGELIEAVYSAHCGGHSANNEEVWSSKPIPYLRGRDDPYDKDAPVARWESRIPKKDLLDMLSRAYDLKVKGVAVAARGSGRRVTEVRLDAKKEDLIITAQSFRVAVNGRFGPATVKSTIFDMDEDGDTYRFSGRGLGHGVGLCQWGAAAQARLGRSYKDILHFYYTDVKIEGYESLPPVAGVSLSDRKKVDKTMQKKDSDEAAAEPKQEEVDQPARENKTRKGTSRKLTGRRVGW